MKFMFLDAQKFQSNMPESVRFPYIFTLLNWKSIAKGHRRLENIIIVKNGHRSRMTFFHKWRAI